jgi:hypothetical protein
MKGNSHISIVVIYTQKKKNDQVAKIPNKMKKMKIMPILIQKRKYSLNHQIACSIKSEHHQILN